MADAAADAPEKPGPAEFRDPFVRRELTRASIWLGLALLIFLTGYLAQPLLLIVGALVFASMLDGGQRLLARVLPIGRGWRILLVTLASLAFLGWIGWLTGVELANQASALRSTVAAQIDRLGQVASQYGLLENQGGLANLGQQLTGSLGRLTSAVSTAFGAIASAFLIFVLGLFIIAEPRLYERGLGWMVPLDGRARFYETLERISWTIRHLMFGRLLGMAIEGVGTWLLLTLGGVPLAALLGILTGLLAFIPNIGAIVSGALILAVGFSAGFETGLWALGVYVIVQIVDSYLIVPLVAKRTVDLAPALVLGAQLLFGALFGLIGLMLADPIVAAIKVALERSARYGARDAAAEA